MPCQLVWDFVVSNKLGNIIHEWHLKFSPLLHTNSYTHINLHTNTNK